MDCVFYDYKLAKVVPCTLVPNEVYEVKDTLKGKEFYVRVKFDPTRFVLYDTNLDELRRYSDELIPLMDIYPSNTQTQKDYHDLVLPGGISGSHASDELDRFEAIVDMLTDSKDDQNNSIDISSETFYRLAEFISYELLFRYCNHTERMYMLTLSAVQITEEPDPIPIPQLLRMSRRIFDKFPTYDLPENTYKIYNYRHFGDIEYIPFPLVINAVNLDYNVHFMSSL